MPKYKVIGRKMFDYMIDIEAASADEAYDKAGQAQTHEWTELVNDDVIEPIEVYDYGLSLNEDTSDDWPKMESGIALGA
jgi:hypothetical protein